MNMPAEKGIAGRDPRSEPGHGPLRFFRFLYDPTLGIPLQDLGPMGRGLNFRRKVPPRGVPLHVLSGLPEFAVRYVEDFSLVGDVKPACPLSRRSGKRTAGQIPAFILSLGRR